MKNKSKIALAATASVVVGALAFALPSIAHEGGKGSGPKAGAERGHSQMDRGNFAQLPATITGIPETVTEVRDAVMGAHYEIFRLDDSVTSLPTTKPETGGHMIGIRPTKDADGHVVVPEIVNGEISSVLGLRSSRQEGVTRFALYPSDGSAAILVTVTTDAVGVSTAVSSSPITVSYDETVAAEAAANKPAAGKGKPMHKGPGFGKGHGPREGSDRGLRS
jgi:hypothetical protein